MNNHRSTPPPAKDPRGFARVTVFGVLWSLALIALAAVAGRDALIYASALSGQVWIEQSLAWSDGMRPLYWWVPVAVGVALVGLVLVYVALRPRPYRGLPVRASTGIFLLDSGLGRLSAAAAEDVDGVDAARGSSNGRTLSVDIWGLSIDRDRELEQRVTRVLDERLQALQGVPRISVRDRGRG